MQGDSVKKAGPCRHARRVALLCAQPGLGVIGNLEGDFPAWDGEAGVCRGHWGWGVGTGKARSTARHVSS